MSCCDMSEIVLFISGITRKRTSLFIQTHLKKRKCVFLILKGVKFTTALPFFFYKPILYLQTHALTWVITNFQSWVKVIKSNFEVSGINSQIKSLLGNFDRNASSDTHLDISTDIDMFLLIVGLCFISLSFADTRPSACQGMELVWFTMKQSEIREVWQYEEPFADTSSNTHTS